MSDCSSKGFGPGFQPLTSLASKKTNDTTRLAFAVFGTMTTAALIGAGAFYVGHRIGVGKQKTLQEDIMKQKQTIAEKDATILQKDQNILDLTAQLEKAQKDYKDESGYTDNLKKRIKSLENGCKR